MTGVRILCIEDNPMNWRLVQRLLGQAGFEMHWAEEGLKGFQMSVELKPDLVLLDINLPGLSGFEVATKLRQQRDLDSTLIVALTAKTMRSDRETALVTGCDGFISKPIDPFHFVDQVKGYLAGRRDRIEQEREGQALRQFSQQVVEHLESQLKEATEINVRLIEAQQELESRNRHLSRLFAVTRRVLGQHEVHQLIGEVLGEMHRELSLSRIHLFKVHGDGGYLQGYAWSEGQLQILPVLPSGHSVFQRLLVLPAEQTLCGDDLVHSPFWEPGQELGWWGRKDQALLLPLSVQGGQGSLFGFLACARSEGAILPHEREVLGLYGGILQASAVNAELIANLNQAHHALGRSYAQAESSLADLQRALAQAGQQERETSVGRLFLGLHSRLQDSLTQAGSGEPEALQRAAKLVSLIHERGGQSGPAVPEWIEVDAFLDQEVELLALLGKVPAGFSLRFNHGATGIRLFCVASDFSEVLGYLVRHGCEGMESGTLDLSTHAESGQVELRFEDHGPSIPKEDMAMAFEPFFVLRDVQAGRHPGSGLAAIAQLMAPYGAACSLESGEECTRVRIRLPLEET